MDSARLICRISSSLYEGTINWSNNKHKKECQLEGKKCRKTEVRMNNTLTESANPLRKSVTLALAPPLLPTPKHNAKNPAADEFSFCFAGRWGSNFSIFGGAGVAVDSSRFSIGASSAMA